MDWIKHGWGTKLLSEPDKDLNYYIDINRITFSENKELEHGLNAINHIKNNYPSPFYLMVSGGIDSQVMALMWKYSNIPHQLISFRYDNDYNKHDIENFTNLANKNNLQVEYIDVSLFNFFENELIDLAKKTNCDSPHICTFMKFREKIVDGTLIYSGGPFHFDGIELNYTILGLERYKKLYNNNMVCYFFNTTPELAGSFNIGFTKLLKTKKLNTPNFSIKNLFYETKAETYKQAGFDIFPQTIKYTGFEKYKDYYDEKGVSPILRAKHAKLPSKRVFDILFRYEIGSKLILPKDSITLLENKFSA
jgi:hypothetical protein